MLDCMSYSDLMERSDAYLELSLDLDEPVEIADFAALFAGVGGEFERHLSQEQPELVGSARMYVKEVRQGSIIAELFANIGDLIGLMDAALIVLGFGSIFNKRIRDLIQGKHVAGASKRQLSDLTKAVKSAASDKSGSMRIKGFRYKDGLWATEFEAEFTADEARKALATIEEQKAELDRTSVADYPRVLMRFTRSDITDAQVGKRSGERVQIDSISDKARPLMYGSELAEEQIKDEIRNSDENIYKRGFVVDINEVSSGGKPSAYSVTHLHQIIDLSDD